MLSDLEARLLVAIEEGLPLTARPYLEVAERLQVSERFVIERLKSLIARGIIGRFGVVVRHAASATMPMLWWFGMFPMSSWRRLHPPLWPYNLFAMVHGRSRADVDYLGAIGADADIADVIVEIVDTMCQVSFRRRPDLAAALQSGEAIGAKFQPENRQPC
jgi:DNA-binding Lrp family transcriptional regulator